MAKRERALAPGEAQQRRAKFCVRLLGYTIVFAFVSAIAIGIPFPGLWQALLVPVLTTSLWVFSLLVLWFLVRMIWFKVKARHFAAVAKMRRETS